MSTDRSSSPGRPRSAHADEAISRAAHDILRAHGPDAVNVASVAARSGVARTTIYRRYADREALLAAALRPLTEQGAPDPELDIEQKLAWVVQRAQDVVDQSIGLGGISAALTGADPELATALRTALETGWEPVRRQIESDLAAGRLGPAVDADVLFDLVLGSYLAQRVRRSAPDEVWRRRTVALLARIVTA